MDHLLLKSFTNQLDIGRHNENFKQKVENVARFLQYHRADDNLKLQNKDLHEDCVCFLEFITAQKMDCSRLVNKKSTQKRESILKQLLVRAKTSSKVY
ncbi:hypothetical protein cypCar_00047179 [Cyprinus carpio]|nr:hypothetical protein cypCar_00047179 [Cyprinus carpio]